MAGGFSNSYNKTVPYESGAHSERTHILQAFRQGRANQQRKREAEPETEEEEEDDEEEEGEEDNEDDEDDEFSHKRRGGSRRAEVETSDINRKLLNLIKYRRTNRTKQRWAVKEDLVSALKTSREAKVSVNATTKPMMIPERRGRKLHARPAFSQTPGVQRQPSLDISRMSLDDNGDGQDGPHIIFTPAQLALPSVDVSSVNINDIDLEALHKSATDEEPTMPESLPLHHIARVDIQSADENAPISNDGLTDFVDTNDSAEEIGTPIPRGPLAELANGRLDAMEFARYSSWLTLANTSDEIHAKITFESHEVKKSPGNDPCHSVCPTCLRPNTFLTMALEDTLPLVSPPYTLSEEDVPDLFTETTPSCTDTDEPVRDDISDYILEDQVYDDLEEYPVLVSKVSAFER